MLETVMKSWSRTSWMMMRPFRFLSGKMSSSSLAFGPSLAFCAL